MRRTSASELASAAVIASVALMTTSSALAEWLRIFDFAGSWQPVDRQCNHLSPEVQPNFGLSRNGSYDTVVYGSLVCDLEYLDDQDIFRVADEYACEGAGFPKRLIGAYELTSNDELKFVAGSGQVQMFKRCEVVH
jgi:hypothetical protein